MRKFGTPILVALTLAVLIAGCSSVDEKVVVRITDNEGTVEPRTILAGYVNERLDRMPPHLLPGTPGDEGRLEFLDEIIRKELLVVAAMRLGYNEGPRAENVVQYFEKSRAEEMLIEELVNAPAEPTEQYLQEFYDLRNTKFQLQEIVIRDEEAINEAYRRVTEGGEDFAAVAKEVSQAVSASEGGLQQGTLWLDLHPLIRISVQDLEAGELSDVLELAGAFYIYKVASRKKPSEVEPLEGKLLTSVTIEARNFSRSIRQYELYEQWLEDAALTLDDDAVRIAGERIGEALEETLPEPAEDLSVEERMERARIEVVPEFGEEEAARILATYSIGGAEKTWTLGALHDTLATIPGIEGIKGTEPGRIRQFLERYVKAELTAHEIETRGYKGSPEMREYVEQRMEEYIVEMTYSSEVVEKTEEPTGEEIKEYYRSHKEDYKKPVGVDVRQIIVGTEAEANLLHQRLATGEADFVELVRRHSIDDWSKEKDGVISAYHQGEKRLDYLQGVVFAMEEGEISEPFRAPGGFAIVEVLAKYPEEQLTFADVGEMVKRNVITLRREARLNEFLDELRATVTIDTINENLKYVKDPAVALEEKEAQRVVITG